MSVTIKDLTSITTPADSAEVWIQDSTQSAPIDRRWSLTNLLAWVKSKLGTAAQSDDTDFLETADYPSDSAWTTVTSLDNDWTGTIHYIKRAGVVYIEILSLDGGSTTSITALTLPTAYRPDVPITGVAIGTAGTDVIVGVTVLTSGFVNIYGDNKSNTVIRATLSFPVL